MLDLPNYPDIQDVTVDNDFSQFNGESRWVGQPGWYSNSGAAGYNHPISGVPTPCRKCDGGANHLELCAVDGDCPCEGVACTPGTCLPVPSPPAGCGGPRDYLSARLVDAPVYRDWSSDPTFMYVRHELLVPLATYEISMVDASCTTDNAAGFSTAMRVCKDGAKNGELCSDSTDCPGGACVGEITTAAYGDSTELSGGAWVGPSTVCSGGANQGQACTSNAECPSGRCGSVSVFDVLGGLAAFASLPSAPDKARQDHIGLNGTVDGKITISDTVEILRAFEGLSYRFDVPQ